jgi:hypothetical protein
MKLSSYYIKARLFPTILTVIPLLILVNTVVASFYYETLKEILNILPIITNLGLSAALLFLMVQVNRLFAKEVFQYIYFQDELTMPTTNHILWNDNFFDITVKRKIREKIQSMIGLTLMSETEEEEDELKSRKQIVTAVSQIRNRLRDNKLLLQHNIEYGFFRNLLGGCLIAIVFSIILIIIGVINHKPSSSLLGIILSVVYVFPIVFSKPIVMRFGNYYSKVLYEQFLSL